MSYAKGSRLRESINILLEQSDTRLKRDLMNVEMRLTMEMDAHVPDTLTRIRVLPSVAVVGQEAPVFRPPEGNVKLDIYVKFLPSSTNTYTSLMAIGKLIKGLPGVKIVHVMGVGGRKVLFKNKPIVI
tara:strand:+ start:385 stop:768 length:384 start_codon:yes stop_codon:yes gene_type:complete